jgi:hypothetical protein
MRITLFCSIFFALALAVPVGAQTKPAPGDVADSASRSGGLLNGRGWRALSAEMRLAFLLGYRDGLALGRGPTGFFPDGMTWGETQESLDRFFETPENRAISITGGLIVLSMRSAGTDEATIAQRIAELRRLENAPPGKK